MKKIWISAFVLLFFSLSFFSCQKSNEFDAYAPVYMNFDEFRSSLKVKGPTRMTESGKIYFKDDFIFVNDVNKGIHVIDNSRPSKARKVAFYEIPGNVDIAIRGHVLFADSYIDLVAIDISNIYDPVEISRIENAFPEVLPPVKDPEIPIAWQEIDRTKGVVTGWFKKSYDYEQSGFWWRGWGGLEDNAVLFDGAASPAAGIAGSMARFMLKDNYLYSVAQPHVLKTIDIIDATDMQQLDSIYTWREMETLFRLGENLFIGTTSGMVIYSLDNPSKPEFLSEFNHMTACDPVVVENDIAYVTLRTGNACMGTSDQLDVIDISDITNPVLMKTYPFFNPHGLGIDDGTLFICDGDDGLKIYDAKDPYTIKDNQLAHFHNINAYDVIPLGDKILLIGDDGLFQYDYSNANNINLIGHISFD